MAKPASWSGWDKRLTVQRHHNTHPDAYWGERFWWLNLTAHEVRRALLGIDQPTAWCGDRNNRLRRYIAHARTFQTPRLP